MAELRVLVVAHQERAEPGVLADAVAVAGGRLEQWDIYAGVAPPAPIDAYAGVVLLGGRMHADDTEGHPWLEIERDLVRRCIADARPLLGLCLGSQVLAQVADGTVRRARVPEIGWHEIALTPAARDDELFRGLPARMPAFQWHVDEFVTAPASNTLACSSVCEQAFRVGAAAWGVQFHPEVNARMVADFVAGYRPDGANRVPDDAVARVSGDTPGLIGEWNRVGRQLFDRFVALAELRGQHR